MRLSAAAVVTGAVAGLLVSAVPGAAHGTAAAPASHAERRAAATRLPAPREPMSYEGTPHGTRATEVLRWKNPRSSSLRRIVVRYASGPKAPTSPRRGHGVHLSSRRAHSVTLSRLGRDTTYSVSIFAINRAGRTSKPAVARFTTPAVIKPGPRGVLRGTVTDAAGNPLAGADVVAYNWEAGDREYATTTNASGAYVLGLPAGAWQLSAAGSQATGGVSDTTGYAYVDSSVSLRGSASATRDFRLPAGGRFTGRIVDTAGRPVAGARPYLWTPLPYVTQGTSILSLSFDDGGPRTDADGRYVVRGMSPGDGVVPCALGTDVRVAGRRTDLYSTCATRSAAVAAGQSVALPDLRMVRGTGTVVTGRLRNAAGAPQRGSVTLMSRSGDPVYAATDKQGYYRLPGVGPGRYRVCGRASSNAGSRTGWAPRCTAKPLQVRGAAVSLGSLTLARGAAATGTVTGPGGRRLSGVWVGIDPHDDELDDIGYGYATTDARGQFRVLGLPSGSFEACARGDVTIPRFGVRSACWRRGHALTLRAKRIRSGVDIRMASGGGITGTVVTRGGKPAAGVGVTASRSTEDEGESTFTHTDSRGRFRFGGLTDGRWRVCLASDDEHSPFDETPARCLRTVTVHRGRVVAVATLELPPPTAIAVQVRDSGGTPVSGVDAVAFARCNDEQCQRTSLLPGAGLSLVASTMTDATGRATLAVGRPGRYAVCLFSVFGTTVSGGSPTGYADACPRGFGVAVAAEKTVTLPLALATGGSVSGRLTDRAGRGIADGRIVVPGSGADDVPGYSLELNRADLPSFDPALPDPVAGSVTGADGRFTIIGVRPGKWTVCAHDAHTDDDGDDGPGRFDTTCAGGAASKGVVVTAGADSRADIPGVKLR